MSWWHDYHKVTDTLDMEKTATWFAPDIELHFGAWDPIYGKEAVLGAFRNFTATMTQMKHTFGPTIGDGNEVFFDATVSYRLRDGSEPTANVASYVRRENGLVRELRVYGDLSPVIAAMAKVA